MALSNATHGAPRKAHGAVRGAPVTGLEFLTESGDLSAVTATGKEGVDFSTLMQGIMQPVPTLDSAAASASPLPVSPPEAKPTEAGEHNPDAAVALLAVALGNPDAPVAPPSQVAVTVPQVTKQPDAAPQAAMDKEHGPGTDGKNAAAFQLAAEKAVTRRAAASAKKQADVALQEQESEETRGTKAEGKPTDAVASAQAPAAQEPGAQSLSPPQTLLETATTPSATAPDPKAQSLFHSNAPIQGARTPVAQPVSVSVGENEAREPRPSEGHEAMSALEITDGTTRAQPSFVTTPSKQGAGEKAPAAEALSPAEASMLEQIAGSEGPDFKSKQKTISYSEKTEKFGDGQSDRSPANALKDLSHSREVRAMEGADAPTARLDVASIVSRVEGASQPLPASTASVAPLGLQPASSLSVAGSLGQQVVDMGVSGQWIEDVARQIASIAANPGHGSFRIASHELGAVRVDIAPSAIGSGSDILMRVDNDAAFAALSDDKERLMQDARMASVRIGELRIDRVNSPQEAARGDMGGNSQQQQNPANPQQGNQSSQAQTSAQMGGNGGHQQGRQDAAALAGQNQGGQNPKAPFTTTVMRDGQADEAGPTRSGRGDSARYA
ncbi:hypothetical protein OOT33_03890 [Sphingobium sp. DEHP117]|uniref:hypothetical protein n=1 Tax=Sphingobium sp. DEHP117 TaxID=2993436 RepID=UPI0027D4CA48|nr:hypothetical protein [Sphingobium sp. DEHP117]MDQ4419581.1 hypothetical protein [Sphingobium sp. DEHP117]